MAINSLNSLSALRLSGMASGMDTETMVESLMRAERMKYNKLVQQKTLMDWKKEANLEVNNLLRTFRDTYLSALKPESYMLSASALQIYKVNMEASNSVKITATRDAQAGSHTVDSITSLAAGASASNTSAISVAGLSLDSKLSELALSTPLAFDGGELSFSINGKTFSFTAEDTLRTVINRVTADKDANAHMSYSSLTGKITVASKTLGSASSLEIENLKGNAFDADAAAFGIAEGTFANGVDAKLKIDGVDVVRDSNTFTIDGIVYTLNGTASSAVSFNVEQDIDTAVNKVKSFVDAYNNLITTLQEKLDEKVYSNYTPLTEEQKAEMSDTQIEKWEKLAKSGMLRNDSYIKGLMSTMRKSFYDAVAGSGASAASIGLSTISYLTGGTIQVNEAKLREAIANDPEKVTKVIAGVSTATSVSAKYSESGLASRIQTTINSYVNDYMGYRTDSLNDQYDRLDDRMDRMEDLLEAKEERYWKQFTAMETALSRMNSQSSWLSQQFASN